MISLLEGTYSFIHSSSEQLRLDEGKVGRAHIDEKEHLDVAIHSNVCAKEMVPHPENNTVTVL